MKILLAVVIVVSLICVGVVAASLAVETDPLQIGVGVAIICGCVMTGTYCLFRIAEISGSE